MAALAAISSAFVMIPAHFPRHPRAFSRHPSAFSRHPRAYSPHPRESGDPVTSLAISNGQRVAHAIRSPCKSR